MTRFYQIDPVRSLPLEPVASAQPATSRTAYRAWGPDNQGSRCLRGEMLSESMMFLLPSVPCLSSPCLPSEPTNHSETGLRGPSL